MTLKGINLFTDKVINKITKASNKHRFECRLQ